MCMARLFLNKNKQVDIQGFTNSCLMNKQRISKYSNDYVKNSDTLSTFASTGSTLVISIIHGQIKQS